MCIKVKWPIRLMLASDFSSMKWLVVFLLPLDGMLVHCWIIPSPTLIFLGGERHCKVSSPIMQCNITSQAWRGRLKPRLLNLEARAPTNRPLHLHNKIKGIYNLWEISICYYEKYIYMYKIRIHASSSQTKLMVPSTVDSEMSTISQSLIIILWIFHWCGDSFMFVPLHVKKASDCLVHWAESFSTIHVFEWLQIRYQ